MLLAVILILLSSAIIFFLNYEKLVLKLYQKIQKEENKKDEELTQLMKDLGEL